MKRNNDCEECGGKIIYKSNELYCSKCGLVFDDEPINFGPERLMQTPETRRTGDPITWLKPFTGTIIGRKPR